METPQKATTGSPIQKDDLWKGIAELPKVVTPAFEFQTRASSGPFEPPTVVCVSNVEVDVSDSTATQKKSVLGSSVNLVTEPQARFPHNLPKNTGLFLGQNSKAYIVIKGTANPSVLAVGSKKANNLIRKFGQVEGVSLRKGDLNDINHILQAEAETSGIINYVWYRVAKIPGGVEIDIGDEKHTRVRITKGKVELVSKGSDTLFYRTQVSQPMVLPAEVGDLDLLKKYLNLNPVQMLLLIAWLSYTLAHPKVSTSKFLILVLQGNQGSGKSFLSWIILLLLDPSIVGVQILPSNSKDLSIAAQNAHVLCYDNLRQFSQFMSDVLCTAATGGSISNRQLYSDADQNVLQLHVALVLNGIHSFIEQPDLAQRCLPLTLLPFNESKRKSEAQLKRELLEDLPAIMRGLFDLIAQVFTYLPTVEVTNPERMIDFVQWLAAMEQAHGSRAGDYQAIYSDVLNQGQLDAILDNSLAAVVLDFAQVQEKGTWDGTPADLLIALNKLVTQDTKRSREWPQNPISLSKRLHPLQASLSTQGVNVEFGRGKHRTIKIASAITMKSNGAINDNDKY